MSFYNYFSIFIDEFHAIYNFEIWPRFTSLLVHKNKLLNTKEELN